MHSRRADRIAIEPAYTKLWSQTIECVHLPIISSSHHLWAAGGRGWRFLPPSSPMASDMMLVCFFHTTMVRYIKYLKYTWYATPAASICRHRPSIPSTSRRRRRHLLCRTVAGEYQRGGGSSVARGGAGGTCMLRLVQRIIRRHDGVHQWHFVVADVFLWV